MGTKTPREQKGEYYLRKERRFGSFLRSIALPAGVDAGQIGAEAHEGVLEVKLPLPEEKAERKKVRIAPKPA